MHTVDYTYRCANQSKVSQEACYLKKNSPHVLKRCLFFCVFISKNIKGLQRKLNENEFLVSSEVVSQPLSLIVLTQVRFVYMLLYSCYAGCHG